jgi:hypothetical protein
MRWGIPSELDINHSTTNICLNEIKECQKNSLGPNFVCLLSHKYGNKFLPSKLELDEFKIINNEIKTNHSEYKDLIFYENIDLGLKIDNLIEYSYKKDENVLPNVYQLLSLNLLIPGFGSKKNIEKSVWLDIQDRLFNLLLKAIEKCGHKQLLTEQQISKFFTSSKILIYSNMF